MLKDAHARFRRTITSLFFLDQRTQEQFSGVSGAQLYVVNEAIFLRSFRALENFLEDVFLRYACGQPTLSGTAVASYLAPRDIEHAYELIRSSQTFLEWNSPDTVIRRAEIYLDNGGPIKAVLSAKQSFLTDIRRIRNHIAHNSRASLQEFTKVVRNHMLTAPVVMPEAGEFLQIDIKRSGAKIRLLRHILEEVHDIGDLLVR